MYIIVLMWQYVAYLEGYSLYSLFVLRKRISYVNRGILANQQRNDKCEQRMSPHIFIIFLSTNFEKQCATK